MTQNTLFLRNSKNTKYFDGMVYLYESEVCVCVCVCVLSPISNSLQSHHVPLSVQFSRQEYCSGLPFPNPGDGSAICANKLTVENIINISLQTHYQLTVQISLLPLNSIHCLALYVLHYIQFV